MLGDVFDVFADYQDNFPPGVFEKYVVPYFKAHTGIEKDQGGKFRHVYDPDSVELQHSKRAERRVAEQFEDVNAFLKAKPYMEATLNTQASLFNRILQDVKLCEHEGQPVPPKKIKGTHTKRIIEECRNPTSDNKSHALV